MSKTCTVCSHKKRYQIEQAIVDKVGYSRISSLFCPKGTKPKNFEKAIERHHKNGHIQEAIEAAANDKKIKHGKSLQDKIDESYKLSMKAAKKAESQDLRAFGGCIGGVLKAIEIEARIKGDGDKEPPKESAFWKAYGNRAAEVFDVKQT